MKTKRIESMIKIIDRNVYAVNNEFYREFQGMEQTFSLFALYKATCNIELNVEIRGELLNLKTQITSLLD
jgi:hypothetical protein